MSHRQARRDEVWRAVTVLSLAINALGVSDIDSEKRAQAQRALNDIRDMLRKGFAEVEREEKIHSVAERAGLTVTELRELCQ